MPSGIYIRTEENTKNLKGISKSSKGKKNPKMARVGEKNGMYGTKGQFVWRDISGLGKGFHGKHTEASKLKMSLTKKGRPSKLKGIHRLNAGCFEKGHEGLKGEKSPTWLGGISFEPYGIEFNGELKEEIRKRDNYRCQECFRHQDELYTKKGRKYKLMIHHIDYNKRNNNSENLISLCRSCHMQTNFKREDWTGYFQKRGGSI